MRRFHMMFGGIWGYFYGHKEFFFKVFTILAFAAFFVNTESFWLDEAFTGRYVLQQSFSDWVRYLLNDGNADAQMPLHPFLAWGVGKLVGTQEWVLRVPSLMSAVVSLMIFSRIRLKGSSGSGVMMLFWFAVQPYLWFYAMEARPYALLILSGSCIAYGIYGFIETRSESYTWTYWVGGGTLLLAFSTMLFPFLVAPLGLYFLVQWRCFGITPNRRQLLILATFSIACVPIGCYYLWTFFRGAQGAIFWDVSLINLAYWAYEVYGFFGLGPSQDALRDAAAEGGLWKVFLSNLLLMILLVSWGMVLAASMILGWVSLKKNTYQNLMMSCFLITGAYALVVFGVGYLFNKPFWARHLAPVVPFLFLGQAVGIYSLWKSRTIIGRSLVVSCFILLSISSLGLRLRHDFRNEDNRAASRFALEKIANKKRVLWAASTEAAQFYGVYPIGATKTKFCEYWFFKNRGYPETLPDVAVIEDSHLFNPGGQLSLWFENNGFELTGHFHRLLIYERREIIRLQPRTTDTVAEKSFLCHSPPITNLH